MNKKQLNLIFDKALKTPRHYSVRVRINPNELKAIQKTFNEFTIREENRAWTSFMNKIDLQTYKKRNGSHITRRGGAPILSRKA